MGLFKKISRSNCMSGAVSYSVSSKEMLSSGKLAERNNKKHNIYIGFKLPPEEVSVVTITWNNYVKLGSDYRHDSRDANELPKQVRSQKHLWLQ